MQTFGLAAFRACIQRNLELAEYAEALVQPRRAHLDGAGDARIVCFRREWPGCDEAETSAAAQPSPKSWNAAAPRWSPPPGWPAGTPSGSASSTRPAPPSTYGWSSSISPARPPLQACRIRRGSLQCTGRPHGDPGPDVLAAVPLLADVPAWTRHALRARGAYLDVAAGKEIIRRWDSDRFFYIILAGRDDIFIDGLHIRTLGPGDHFGELAARDWGGGYGYARLATVRCAQPGGLLQANERRSPVARRHRTGGQGQARRYPGRTSPESLERRSGSRQAAS